MNVVLGGLLVITMVINLGASIIIYSYDIQNRKLRKQLQNENTDNN